jgi:hypothetical protein
MILNFLLRYVVTILFYTNYKADSRLRFGGVSPGAAAFLALFYTLGTLQYVKQLVAILNTKSNFRLKINKYINCKIKLQLANNKLYNVSWKNNLITNKL